MVDINEFSKRRKQVMQMMGPAEIMILKAASIAYRNGESEYPYRQNSDFYYLTGFEEPDAVAVLAPNRHGGEFILFNRARHREEEIWTGLRAGQVGAKTIYGANESYPHHELESKLPELLMGRDVIHYTLGVDNDFDAILMAAVNKIRGKIRSGIQSPLAWVDMTNTVHEMRLIKSVTEITLMRKAAHISALAHQRAIKACKPGINEYQLEAEFTYECQRQGARFPAYTPIVGAGENSCILHYVSNNQVIAKDSIVLIDAGCEYENYASDVTRSFPANGRFSAEQKAIYEIVLAAQKAGIQSVKPNASFISAQESIVKIITQGLLDLGLLKGSLTELIEKQAYFPFYMHKSGHWLGLEVHDVGRYKVNGQWRQLQPGMVLTVEPGIYISAMPGIDQRWHGIGIRIEDDILVTSDGHDILSQAVPKEINDIEAMMNV